MIPILASPLARWGAIAAVCLTLAGWAWAERAGRQIARLELHAAQLEIAGLQQRIRELEVRRDQEDRAAREPDPVGRLHDEWQRPD